MPVRHRAAAALLVTMSVGATTIAGTQSFGTANASGTQPASVVGRAKPADTGQALNAVLGLTRSVDGTTYRAAGTYSAGSALTSQR
jgi:hypothetical protein